MPRARGLRVLVVDDHSGFAETLENVLETVGCDVSVSTTPFAGITLSDTHRFDLVLVDYRMPRMDGLEFMQHVRRRGHRCLLLVTGHADEVRPEEATRCGAAGILPKPVDVDRLLEIVRYVADAGEETISLPGRLLECGALRTLRPRAC
jgi:DNA-binding NtrC family response regulator